MAAASNYFSTSQPGSGRPYTATNSQASGSYNMGTSSYASDALEIRITTGATNGPTTLTKEHVERFLEDVRAWLYDQDQGLDYVTTQSGAANVP